jgi:hypothetical protein
VEKVILETIAVPEGPGVKPKKILVVSMTPTHPPNAGNRIRILGMSRWLREQGHEVHFLYSDQGWGDNEGMKAFWGNGSTG